MTREQDVIKRHEAVYQFIDSNQGKTLKQIANGLPRYSYEQIRQSIKLLIQSGEINYFCFINSEQKVYVTNTAQGNKFLEKNRKITPNKTELKEQQIRLSVVQEREQIVLNIIKANEGIDIHSINKLIPEHSYELIRNAAKNLVKQGKVFSCFNESGRSKSFYLSPQQKKKSTKYKILELIKKYEKLNFKEISSMIRNTEVSVIRNALASLKRLGLIEGIKTDNKKTYRTEYRIRK